MKISISIKIISPIVMVFVARAVIIVIGGLGCRVIIIIIINSFVSSYTNDLNFESKDAISWRFFSKNIKLTWDNIATIPDASCNKLKVNKSFFGNNFNKRCFWSWFCT